jgi:Iron-sulfur cluster-binding domain
MKRERAFMADDVWTNILSLYIVPYKHAMLLTYPTFIPHKDGEPLLNKRLPDRLRDLAAVAPDMSIDIYSHGLLLPKWCERGQDFFEFLSTLPNHVRFMMSFHPYNHDGSGNNYSATILYLQAVLRDPPRNVEFITVSHKSKWVSDAEQEAWRQTWADYPIKVHCNALLNPWTGRIESDVKFNGCPYENGGHWFFGVTGNVIACCLDLEEEIVLGNVLTHDPGAMYARTQAFYQEQHRILAAREQHPRGVCRDCFGQHRDDVPAELIPLGVRVA